MKRTISLILSFVILLCVYPFTSVQAAVADDGYDYIFLNHTSFSVDNGWSGAENSTNGYSGKVLRAGAEGAETSAYVKSAASGTYDLWVRTGDFKSNPGTRTFSVRFNTGYLHLKAGSFDDVDWTTIADGGAVWKWEKIGSVNMTNGVVNKITLIADNSYTRIDCMLLTNNLTYTPLEKGEISTLEKHMQNSASMTYNKDLFGTTSYVLTRGGAETLGTWTLNNGTYLRYKSEHTYAFFGGYMHGRSDSKPQLAESAIYRPYIYEAGTYSVWVRTGQDPNSTNAKADSLVLDINGKKSENLSFHPEKPGFAWEYAGEYEFSAGANTIKLMDVNGFWPRFNCLYITKDASCAPSNIESEFKENVTFVDLRVGTSDMVFKPQYISDDTLTPSSTVEISNDKISVAFYNVSDGEHQFVQNKVTYDGYVLKDREDMFVRQLYRYGSVSRASHTRGSPIVNVTNISAINTAKGDWVSDDWGVSNDKIWTNISTFNTESKTVSNVKGETVKVKLNIPVSGNYYGVTRGYTYNFTDEKRGYTIMVNGEPMTSDNGTHYFNVTNATEKEKYAFSYNKDPMYLEAGVAEIELTSFNEYAMRTSFFALIPAQNTTDLQAEIQKLTDYDTAVSLLGGDALKNSYYGSVPVTDTGYPHPLTYDYIQKVTEPALSTKTDDLFYMGMGEWLVPKSAEKTGENQVTLTYENDYVDVKEVWELKAGDEEPRVTLSYTAKKRGGYYVVIPTHDTYTDEQYEYGLAPMQYRGHQFPVTPLLITEQFLFTPMVSVSLPETNSVVPGKKVTYGYTVEPAWIDGRWVYNDDYDFGAVMRSSQYNESSAIAPSLVASAPGGRNGEMLIGEKYTIQFRPIYRTDDWFETFSHVTQDLFEVRDYRENYYHSVTDAILNTTDLMMDDFYSGWDDNSMAFWNMEGRAFTTQSSPLEIVQRYLLTDDQEILRERAIPTVIGALTKPTHFKANTTVGGSQDLYLGGPETWPTAIGEGNNVFNASVLGGLYQMSQGSLQTAMDKAISKAGNIKDTNSTASYVSDLVAMYKYTGDEAYLTKAKAVADNYLVTLEASKTTTTPVDYNAFAYISFMPHISSLLDIYEVTGEQKYLDAAEYAGQVILTMLWSSGIDGDRANQDMLLDKESMGKRVFMAGHDFWWMGDIKWRPGVALDENMMPTEDVEVSAAVHPLRQLGFDEITPETVPFWVVSRTGIGLEQPSTFYSESRNIMMSSWAGDMMRLAEYLDDKQFEAAARNAVIGRFGTYPGYYLNRFASLYMKEDYHTDSPVDVTALYWHHIPSFLSMVEDFLITQAWNWSDRNVEFPSTRQQGYAYFNNRQYGYAPGKFFDQNNMWLWIDDDVVTTSSVNLDWIAARKDGVMGIALMNEHSEEATYEVQLGTKADADYSGKVLLYTPDGDFTAIDAQDGKFAVTIPAKSLVGAVLSSDEIQAPSFANSKYQATNDGETTITHDDVSGAGSVLQFTPESYFAHIYVENKNDTASQMTVNYTIGEDETVHTVSDAVYPFEVVLEIGEEDVNKPINYTVKVKNAEGTADVTSKTYTLQPLDCVSEEVADDSKATILLTGTNVAASLGLTTQNKWDKTNFILAEYGFYKEGVTEKPTIIVDVPADGNYYVYANTRTGASSMPERRYVSMNITQNGKTINVEDSNNSTFKFGYSLDVQNKLSDITAGEYWTKGLGTMASKPVSLKKGTAEITLEFGMYGGFDFILLTSDAELRAELNECRVYEDKNIFKFWKDNTALKQMLASYVDVTAPSAPTVSDKTKPYAAKGQIEIQSADKDVVSYQVYLNNALNTVVPAEDAKTIAEIAGFDKGDSVYVVALDGRGNASAKSNTIVLNIEPLRPATFANLKSGTNYASVSAAKTADVLPDGYMAVLTTENMTKETDATKLDFDPLTGLEDNYYVNVDAFRKVYTGKFVIPENEDGEDKFYQFISSYLRVYQSTTVWVDERRTHFILVDGKAVTEDGLADWNGKTTYDRTLKEGNYGTNSYVFGSEYPFEFTTESSTTKNEDCSKNYPHNVVNYTGHLWGYSPAVQLEPGVHTVEVYSRGFNGWFNNLIITDDVGYDITKLLYGGLKTRESGWVNNFTNVVKPSFTDYTAPVLTSGLEFSSDVTKTTLSWNAANDDGFGASGKNVGYLVEISDKNGEVVETFNTVKNSAVVSSLEYKQSYTAKITAYDGAGNKSNTITQNFTVSAPAVGYIYGKEESQIVVNADVDENCAGNLSIFVVGYNMNDGCVVDSITPYELTVEKNKSATLTFDTPASKEGIVYKVLVWKKQSFHPLCLTLNLKTN